jgi:hypothetical protein
VVEASGALVSVQDVMPLTRSVCQELLELKRSALSWNGAWTGPCTSDFKHDPEVRGESKNARTQMQTLVAFSAGVPDFLGMA